MSCLCSYDDIVNTGEGQHVGRECDEILSWLPGDERLSEVRESPRAPGRRGPRFGALEWHSSTRKPGAQTRAGTGAAGQQARRGHRIRGQETGREPPQRTVARRGTLERARPAVSPGKDRSACACSAANLLWLRSRLDAVDRGTAVAWNQRAGEGAGVGGGQEHRQVGDVFGGAEASQRHRRDGCLLLAGRRHTAHAFGAGGRAGRDRSISRPQRKPFDDSALTAATKSGRA